MTQVGIRWVKPPKELANAIDQYGDSVAGAVLNVAERIATIMERDAKATRPWTDRTGDARAGLFGEAERDVAREIVTIYLSHGPNVDYGIFLELAHGGNFAVIMRTIEAHLPELMAELRNAFR